MANGPRSGSQVLDGGSIAAWPDRPRWNGLHGRYIKHQRRKLRVWHERTRIPTGTCDCEGRRDWGRNRFRAPTRSRMPLERWVSTLDGMRRACGLTTQPLSVVGGTPAQTEANDDKTS